MNETQVRATIDLIKNNGLTEVRVIGQKTLSGYFKDVDNLVNHLKRFDADNIYFVMNDINDGCYSRSQSEKIEIAKNTTSDNDITARRWLLIDIDPKRPAGVSSSEEEKQKAKETGNKVFKFLRDVGFSAPVSADSGNGYHLLYNIYLGNTPENAQLVKSVLSVLDMFFSDSGADIDTSVFNASRITKLYGTMARKGRSTKERPHRESKILHAPDEIKSTDVSLLRKVADMMPKPPERSRSNNYGQDVFDLDRFIHSHGINAKSVESYQGGQKYILDHCLFNPEHKGKDAAIFKLSNGALGYKCFHNSCSDKTWKDVRDMFEPDRYKSSREFTRSEPRDKTPQKTDGRGDKFLTMGKIKKIDRSQLVYMRSHFLELDKKIVGFLKGELSIWSGVNASGKSTILGQIALNAINDGYKVMMFSGELTSQRVKGWLHLQAAGRQFTQSTQWENYFYVPDNTGDKIDRWMSDKFILYNNDYGNEYNQLVSDVTEQLEKQDIDMVILDNIMALDLDELDSQENARQKKAFLKFKEIATKYKTHIHVVAHPRKSARLLRKDDISGSGNMMNLADNVFIIHRVNNDFIKYSNEFFGEREASKWHGFNNVVEVCKNRDIGVMDFMVGLYFEKESKRFLNEPYENIVYDWQDLETSPEYRTDPIKPDEEKFKSELPFAPDNDVPF